MPWINGRYHMNPFYGRALEKARMASEGGVWPEEDPEPVERPVRDEDFWNDDPSGGTQQDSSAHWVTIDHRHVLIPETPQNRSRANRKPGNKAARIVFNETSGLRLVNGNSEDLHDARVAIAHTLRNAAGMQHPPATVTDTLTPSAAQAILTDAQARAAWADAQEAVREAAETPDDTGEAIHFLLDYNGVGRQPWATQDRETASYGPFTNAAGGGDVPRGAQVTVRIYTERPRY